MGEIGAFDIRLLRAGRGEFLLHHAVGSPANGSDYGPIETRLGPRQTKRIGAAGGRPTNSDLSYFNLEWDGGGMIIVVGWPGQWAVEFTRDEGAGIRVRAGQELTHFKLLPGEKVRGPLIVLQRWKGDWLRAQNIWRRWMIAHNLPRPGGRLPPPQLLGSSARAYHEMIHGDEEKEVMFIDRYLEEGLKIDYWWMDAGWYVQKEGWPQTGTWEVDPKRFPRGFKPISDHAHARDVKILVWFEPERAAPGTWLYENHPEWLLSASGEANRRLLNLGNPDARNWLSDHIDGLLRDNGIDLYRQDFNMNPLAFWRENDTPERQGITEINHVTGYLAFWDELRRRHPNLLIDSCSSGGRRNDLETMRRAVPLWRSDYAYEPVGHQCMTYGISLWIPFHGTGTVATADAPYYGGVYTPVEPYAFWSNAGPSLVCGFDVRERGLDYESLRRLIRQWRQISHFYCGDFYPLTSYSRDNTVWMAWQFDRPESGEGVIQVFRRAQSPYESARFRLRGLDPESVYAVSDLDEGGSTEMPGRELTDVGLLVAMPSRPAARLFTYRKVQPGPGPI